MRFHGLRRLAWGVLLIALAALGVALMTVRRPEDLPWTPLDLTAPIGLATAAKLQRLDATACPALLARAGARFAAVPPFGRSACRVVDAVRLATVPLRPANAPLACPLAAGLLLWQREVVQPAAVALLGTRMVRVEHYGSYACRPVAGHRSEWSEHAAANALDVAAFVLADGRRISVARHWRGPGAAGRFLRAVHDGGCRLFGTVLGPDYNRAHADHLHLDNASRMGWSYCR